MKEEIYERIEEMDDRKLEILYYFVIGLQPK